MATRVTSIKVILDKILRNPMFSGLSYETVVDYYIDFVGIVGVPDLFEDKKADLTIVEYRAEIPLDFMEPTQVLIEGIPARHATDTLHQFYRDVDTVPNDVNANLTGAFNRTGDVTYSIQGGYIYTAVKNATVTLLYKAVPLIDGLPAIPDDPTFMRAFRLYVEVEYAKILYMNKKIEAGMLERLEQDYCFAVGAYETSSHRLDLGKAEAFFNMFSTLLVRNHEFSNRFRNTGNKEIINNH